MKLGKAIVGFGKIPAGSDANSLWHCFQADAKPIWITNGSWWGGDANETLMLYIAPPGPSVANGTQSPADFGGDERNAIAVTPNGAWEGALYTNTEKGAMFGSRNQTTQGFYIPANWTVLLWSDTANTATWKVSLQGFEIEG